MSCAWDSARCEQWLKLWTWCRNEGRTLALTVPLLLDVWMYHSGTLTELFLFFLAEDQRGTLFAVSLGSRITPPSPLKPWRWTHEEVQQKLFIILSCGSGSSQRPQEPSRNWSDRWQIRSEHWIMDTHSHSQTHKREGGEEKMDSRLLFLHFLFLFLCFCCTTTHFCQTVMKLTPVATFKPSFHARSSVFFSCNHFGIISSSVENTSVHSELSLSLL